MGSLNFSLSNTREKRTLIESQFLVVSFSNGDSLLLKAVPNGHNCCSLDQLQGYTSISSPEKSCNSLRVKLWLFEYGSDPRSYEIRPEKNSGLFGIQAHFHYNLVKWCS